MDAYQITILCVGAANLIGAFVIFPMKKKIENIEEALTEQSKDINHVDKEVLKLRVHMSDHYVTKPDLERDLNAIKEGQKELATDFRHLRESSHKTNTLLHQLVNAKYLNKQDQG